MSKVIYIRNVKDKVDTYFVKINFKEIRRVQKEIDDYSGKGEIYTKTCDLVSLMDEVGRDNKKLDIISSRVVKRRDNSCYMDVCEYKYYAYKQHILSKLCDEIMSLNNSIELSSKIKELLDYNGNSLEEKKFVVEILKNIKLRYVSKLEMLRDRVSLGYNMAVEEEIANGKVLLDEELTDKLNGNIFTRNFSRKKMMKKQVLSMLPSYNKISKF